MRTGHAGGTFMLWLESRVLRSVTYAGPGPGPGHMSLASTLDVRKEPIARSAAVVGSASFRAGTRPLLVPAPAPPPIPLPRTLALALADPPPPFALPLCGTGDMRDPIPGGSSSVSAER
jgi:hypothetical protein